MNVDEEVVGEDAVDTGELRVQVKKRKLYRHAADTTQIWFPFEMAVQVAQELVWQSGGTEVKWVLHGSPGAGNVVLGSAQGVVLNAQGLVDVGWCMLKSHSSAALSSLSKLLHTPIPYGCCML